MTSDNYQHSDLLNFRLPRLLKFHLPESPSLDLARDLAAAKEKSAVIEYLDAHQRLCGVDNEWAFQIRYKLEHDREEPMSSIAEREHYDDCKMQHQLDVLRASKEVRDNHLPRHLQHTQRALEIWERRTKEKADSQKHETNQYAERTAEAYKRHLENLKPLSQLSE